MTPPTFNGGDAPMVVSVSTLYGVSTAAKCQKDQRF